MTAIEYGNDIIIIDAGFDFSGRRIARHRSRYSGYQLSCRDKNKVRGLLITHGHEDHVGAIAYLLKEVNVPVYATKLTLALADNKLREHRINRAQLVCINPGIKSSSGVLALSLSM